MRRLLARAAAAGVAMLAAVALSAAMVPRTKLADRAPRLDLDRMVPREFAGWRVDRTLTPVGPAPGVVAALDKVYDQTLARTYIDAAGNRVMLSIAYGSDQRARTTQVHQPESCYTMQGFVVVGGAAGRLDTGHGVLPVKRLMAVQGPRSEPITYWLTVGDRATLPGMDRKLAQLRYGLTGEIADGMLVRMSTISRDAARAYFVHDAFIRDLLAAVAEPYRRRLAGAARA